MTGLELLTKAFKEKGFSMSEITPTGDDNIGSLTITKESDPTITKQYSLAPIIDSYGALHMFHMNAEEAATQVVEVMTMFESLPPKTQ